MPGNFGKGVVVNDLVLVGTFSTSMGSVANENTITEGRFDFLAQLDFPFRMRQVTDLAAKLQGFPAKFGPMSFDVSVGALFTIEVRVVVVVSEALHSQIPIFVGHARLK